ncbi:hypothetical protein E5288_WYG014282 [Bos mutus]|uniref:Uncharacterized protein n=1 Tax=Bos mutus TaxID=72004 RepID=A0A6B0R3I7_9CETA|nr:hypothetical protein [Bos mutus]
MGTLAKLYSGRAIGEVSMKPDFSPQERKQVSPDEAGVDILVSWEKIECFMPDYSKAMSQSKSSERSSSGTNVIHNFSPNIPKPIFSISSVKAEFYSQSNLDPNYSSFAIFHKEFTRLHNFPDDLDLLEEKSLVDRLRICKLHSVTYLTLVWREVKLTSPPHFPRTYCIFISLLRHIAYQFLKAGFVLFIFDTCEQKRMSFTE